MLDDSMGPTPNGVSSPLAWSESALSHLHRVAWDGLTQDAGLWVMVLREDGIIAYASPALTKDLSPDGRSIVGRPVTEVMPPTIAGERLQCYLRVMRSQQPLHVEGLIGGSLIRCAMRPIPRHTPDEMAHMICVSRRIGPDAEPCPEPRHRAECDDLGERALLSDRELEVLRLIGLGYTTAQIGKAMHRSVKTIEWHRVSLGSKLGVSNRVELARIAIRLGLTSPYERATPPGVTPVSESPK